MILEDGRLTRHMSLGMQTLPNAPATRGVALRTRVREADVARGSWRLLARDRIALCQHRFGMGNHRSALQLRGADTHTLGTYREQIPLCECVHNVLLY